LAFSEGEHGEWSEPLIFDLIESRRGMNVVDETWNVTLLIFTGIILVEYIVTKT
jgi:hypothetical protein